MTRQLTGTTSAAEITVGLTCAARARRHRQNLRQGLPNEGRRSSAAFDVGFYLGYYGDLQAAFGSHNFQAAFDHWVRSGMAEGRFGI